MKIINIAYVPQNTPGEWMKHVASSLAGTDRGLNHIFHEPKLLSKENPEPPLGKDPSAYDALMEVCTFHHIPTMPDFTLAARSTKVPYKVPSDMYAFVAFLDAIYLATELGADYFWYYETDCRFNKGWWTTLLEDNFSIKPHDLATCNVIVGTPVCWHPWSLGHEVSNLIMKYGANVAQSTGVAMAFEGDHYGSMSFYVNGALALYPTELMHEVFQRWFSALQYPRKSFSSAVPPRDLVGYALDVSQHISQAVAFDAYIGRYLIQRFGITATVNRIYPSRFTYSGCGNHHVPLSYRKNMLLEKIKGAVHHLKPEECPFTF